MTVAGGFALWAAALFVNAALARTPAGARAGVLIAVVMMPLPLLVSGDPLLRAALAFVLAVAVACAIDLARRHQATTFSGRVIHALALHVLIDTFTATPVPRRFDGRAAVRFLFAIAIGLGGILLWRVASDAIPTWRIFAWNLLAIVLVLAVAEFMTSTVQFATQLFGVTLQPAHDKPHLSRSVGEFWSKRWNLMTGLWLRRHCFLPLVRRGPLLALIATFTLSAAMHVYLIFVPAEPWAWLAWAAFFMAQPLLVLAERKLGVRHWPPLAARAWTIGSLSLLSPLLFVPILHLIDPSF